MIHAYTGNGKGKTTAAIGLLIRAFGAGRRVGIIFLDKGSETYRHNELVVLDRLDIEYHITGLERMKPDGSFRFGVTDEDRKEAERAIAIAGEVLDSQRLDLLVLDEALSSVTYGLLDKSLLLNFLQRIPENLELVLTGRSKDSEIFDQVDLVTSMVKQKHYFDQGVPARPGIEY